MNFKEKLNPSTTAKVIQSRVPRVAITSEALTKMYIYVDQCSDEIGWLGTVQELDSGVHFIIDDVHLFKQEVHATTTEITPEGLSEFAETLLALPNGVEVWNSIKMWGHSHVNMGVTPSSQDDKQMNEFADIGHDYFIRLICNKKGDMKLDFYNYKLGVAFHDIPWEIYESDEDVQLQEEINRLQRQLEERRKALVETHKEAIKEEMKDKVSKLRTTYTKPNTYNSHGSTYTNQYGRYINGVWTRWEPGEYDAYIASGVDKKKLNQSGTNTTTNNSNGSTSTDTKKKLESNDENSDEERNVISIGRYLDIDFFQSDDEVVEELGSSTLMALSLCRDLQELLEELEEMGYINMFTDNDLESIFRVAFKYREYVIRDN